MVRVGNLEAALDFYCNKLGLVEIAAHRPSRGEIHPRVPGSPERRREGKGEQAPLVELTYNWDEHEYQGGRNFGHLAYRVDDIYALCDKLMKAGVTINRPPRDGHMAFVRSPDGISIELLQKGEPKPSAEPWASMPNTGAW